MRNDYQVIGIFTSQEELDAAPEYKTGTSLDTLKLGALMIADINNDKVIDEQDKIASGYLKIDSALDNTDVVIVSSSYLPEPEK